MTKYVFLSRDPLTQFCQNRHPLPAIEGCVGDIFDFTEEEKKLPMIAQFISAGEQGFTNENRFEPVVDVKAKAVEPSPVKPAVEEKPASGKTARKK